MQKINRIIISKDPIYNLNCCTNFITRETNLKEANNYIYTNLVVIKNTINKLIDIIYSYNYNNGKIFISTFNIDSKTIIIHTKDLLEELFLNNNEEIKKYFVPLEKINIEIYNKTTISKDLLNYVSTLNCKSIIESNIPAIFKRNAFSYSYDEQISLLNKKVMIFGIGGVGCTVAELLVRNGVGTIILVDGDKFEESNINRQLGATQNTLGLNKAKEMQTRLKSINPDANIIALPLFLNNEILNDNTSDLHKYAMISDIFVDCVDGYNNKALLSKYAKINNKIYTSSSLGNNDFFVGCFDNNFGMENCLNKEACFKYKRSPNPCILSIDASLLAKLTIDKLLNRELDINFIYIYKDSTKTITKQNLIIYEERVEE